MHFLLKMVVFQPAMLDYQRVHFLAMIWSPPWFVQARFPTFLAATHAVKAADYWRAEFNVKEEPMTVSWEFLNLPRNVKRLHKTRPLINSVVLNVFCLTVVNVMIRKCHIYSMIL